MIKRHALSLRSIAFLFLTVMIMAATVVSAKAASVISLTVKGSLKEGSNVTLTWNKMDNTAYYLVSIRDVTTDQLLVFRQNVGTKTSFQYGYELTANHSYRAWVAAIAVGSDPDDIPSSHQTQTVFTIKPDVCSHDDTYKDIKSKLYKSISSTEHRVTTNYNLACHECDAILQKDQTITEIDPHYFDKAGDCYLCDYRVSCTHSKKVFKAEKSGYTIVDEDEHKYFEIGHYVCSNANCGKVIEPYQHTEYEEHVFSNNKCKYCGYTKKVPLSISVARGQKTAYVGDGITASVTVKGGSGSFNYAWEVLHNGVVVKRTDYSMTTSYGYTANKTGNWQFKAYVKDKVSGQEITAVSGTITVSKAECAHNNRAEKPTTTDYKKYSDTKHEILSYYSVVCADCGKMISEVNYRSVIVNHSIDANGKCICGYVKPTDVCKHTSSKAVKIGNSKVQQYDEEKHKVVSTYQDVCANSKCGIVLVASREEFSLIVHQFDENKKCYCGYVQPTKKCDHAESESLISSRFGRTDNFGHELIQLYRYECDCKQVSYEKERSSIRSHTFDGNGRCACGYVLTVQNECKHSKIKTEKIGTSRLQQNDDKTHKNIATYKDICAECGVVVVATREEITLRNHSFDGKGHCVCGYSSASTSPCKHNNKISEKIGTSKLQQNDDTTHKNIANYKDVCVDCGAVIVASREEVTNRKHTFDKNNRCVCGYIKGKGETGNQEQTSKNDLPQNEPSHSPEATLPPKANHDDNVIIEGSFGREGYIVPLGRLVNIFVRASSENAKLTRVTINVDGSGVDRLASVPISATRWNGSLTLDSSLYPLNKSGVYTLKLYVATDAGDPNWTIVDYAILHVCGHTPIETLKDTRYEEKDAYSHKVIKTYHYECACKQVNYDEEKTSIAPHTINSGICALCDYDSKCKHTDFLKIVSTVVENNPNSGSSHFVITTYESKCICGALNPNPIHRASVNCNYIDKTGLNDLHESKGHRYLLSCECGNEKISDEYAACSDTCNICKKNSVNNDEIVSTEGAPSHSFEEALPPKVNDDANVTINGSFTKKYYVISLGESLNVHVDASCENANLVRATVNVDGSGIDRLASTSIAGTSWSGSLTLSSGTYPLNKPGTYTLKLFVGVDKGEPNSALVDQATLVITDESYDDLLVKIEHPGEVHPGDKLIVRSNVSGGSGEYSYLWSWIHPNGSTLSYPSKNCCILSAETGAYTFTLTVTDKETGEPCTSEQMTVEIKPAKEEYDPMKISFIGGNEEVKAELAIVGIAAECSVTGGSGRFEYGWRIDRDGLKLFSYSYGLVDECCTWYADKVGVYTFHVTARDLETGRTQTASRSITVVAEKYAPLKLDVTSAPMYADAGEKVRVQAEISGGVGDVQASWKVYLGNKRIASGDGLAAEFVPAIDGKYIVRVEVEDEAQVLSESISVVVGEHVKCSLTVPDDSHTVGSEIRANVSVVDGIGPFSYEWMLYLDGGFKGSDLDSDSNTYSWRADQAGNYRIKCTVYDMGMEELVGDLVWASDSLTVEVIGNPEVMDEMKPAVLSVSSNAQERVLFPGDPFTATIVCNKYTSNLRVTGAENGNIGRAHVDGNGRTCFDYMASFSENGIYQVRFTAVDPMGVYVESQTYSVVVTVTVCDHTVGEPVPVDEGKPEYANNDEHLINSTYEKACVCRAFVESIPQNRLEAHTLSEDYAYELEHNDEFGHRKYYVCSVCNGHSLSGGDNPGKDDYSEYEEDLGKSGRCAVCQDKYNEKQRIMEAQSLLQGLGYDIGTAGVDGILGKDTLAALNAFRADVMGLGAIGNVDDDTLEALRIPPIQDDLVIDEECMHDQGYVLSEHPHRHVYCKECNEEILERYSKDGQEDSTCDECFSKDTYYADRALEMAQLAKSVYNIPNYDTKNKNVVTISDNFESMYSNEWNKTEARIAVTSTGDAQLVVTVSFEGSTFDDFLGDGWDDWISKDLYTNTNKEGIRIGMAEGMDRFVSNYIENDLVIDCDIEGMKKGEYTFKDLLTRIKDDPNAHLRITGHSLGGSYAQCFAYYMISEFGIPNDKVEAYTFASLIPFTDEFINKHPELDEANIYNFIHVQDIAPDIGPTYDYLGNQMLEFVDFAFNVIDTAATEFGGNSKVGSNIGKNIYINSDLNGGLWNLGTTHAMDTYLHLIANFEDENHDGFDTVNVKDVIERSKKAEKEISKLYSDICVDYTVFRKTEYGWEAIDTMSLGYDLVDLYTNWDKLLQLYETEEIRLYPFTDELRGLLESERAGELELNLSAIVPNPFSNKDKIDFASFNFDEYMTKEDVYTTIANAYNEYIKYNYIWNTSNPY